MDRSVNDSTDPDTGRRVHIDHLLSFWLGGGERVAISSRTQGLLSVVDIQVSKRSGEAFTIAVFSPQSRIWHWKLYRWLMGLVPEIVRWPIRVLLGGLGSIPPLKNLSNLLEIPFRRVAKLTLGGADYLLIDRACAGYYTCSQEAHLIEAKEPLPFLCLTFLGISDDGNACRTRFLDFLGSISGAQES